MFQYVWILIWLAFMYFLANRKGFRTKEIVCGNVVARQQMWFAILTFAPIIWMAGNRGWFADTGMYILEFYDMPSSITGLPTYLAGVDKDKGFYLLSAILKMLFGNNVIRYLTILAVLQGIPIVVVFRKYSPFYILSIFLFIASSDYLSWMFNGLRQFMAVTIIFAATDLMIKKKYTALLIVILFASTMHQSALIMIPLVFIAQGKAWNKKTLALICLGLLCVLFVGEFTNILNDALSETQYKNVFSDAAAWNDNGSNPIRVLVYSVPAILAFIGRRRIQHENNSLINLCTNMSIISAGLYIISMVTSGIFIGRLPIYASLYGYILLPWEIGELFSKRSKKIVYLILIAGYLMFYYIQIHWIWGLI